MAPVVILSLKSGIMVWRGRNEEAERRIGDLVIEKKYVYQLIGQGHRWQAGTSRDFNQQINKLGGVTAIGNLPDYIFREVKDLYRPLMCSIPRDRMVFIFWSGISSTSGKESTAFDTLASRNR